MGKTDNNTSSAWRSVRYELPHHRQIVLVINADKMDCRLVPGQSLDVATFYEAWSDEKYGLMEDVFVSRGYASNAEDYTHWMPVLSVSSEPIFND